MDTADPGLFPWEDYYVDSEEEDYYKCFEEEKQTPENFGGGLVILASLQVNIKSWAEELHQEPNAAVEARRWGRRITGVSEVAWWMKITALQNADGEPLRGILYPSSLSRPVRDERVACNPELPPGVQREAVFCCWLIAKTEHMYKVTSSQVLASA